MRTIKGQCKTNLDDYDVSEVKEFYNVPNIGDRVTCWHKGGIDTSLRVVQITHTVKLGKPFILVELHN